MEAPNALNTLLFRSTTAINLIGPSEGVLWRFARCWLTTLRAADTAALAQARADFAALPADLPGRADLAVALDDLAANQKPAESRRQADLFMSDNLQDLIDAASARLKPEQGTPSAEDLAIGIRLLEKTLAVQGSPLHPDWSRCSAYLAMACRIGGQPARSRRVAIDGLRGHPWQLLLAADRTGQREIAQHAVAESGEVAGSCLRDGDVDSAIRAWEIALGLEYYAHAEARDLDTRLREAGWTGGIDPKQDRADLLAALTGAPPPADGILAAAPDAGPIRLLDVPEPWELQAALAKAGLDALVYLVPAGSGLVAVIVPNGGGEPYAAPLPAPTMAALLDGHFPTAPVRLGLIPLGELVAVRWHEPRRAAVTFPGSARLLCDAAFATSAPLNGDGLVVAHQDDEPAVAIRDAFLPRARVTADRRRMLSWLENPAGGPAAHIAGSRARAGDGSEHLMLTEVDAIQFGAAVRARGSGLALVTIAGSAPEGRVHRFGLEIVLRANGVRSVVSARWPVRDKTAADTLMYLVYHELSTGDGTPMDALNAAQQVLRGERAPSPGLPTAIRRETENLARTGDATWAAFVHSGW